MTIITAKAVWRGLPRTTITATIGSIALLALNGCSPIKYANGLSAHDLPTERSQVIVGDISQNTHLAWSDDRPDYKALIKNAMTAELQNDGISVVENKGACASCITLTAFYYYRPWNPLVGGEASVHATALGPDGKELFSTDAGLNFGPLHLAMFGGNDGIMRTEAGAAADYVANELQGKSSIVGR